MDLPYPAVTTSPEGAVFSAEIAAYGCTFSEHEQPWGDSLMLGWCITSPDDRYADAADVPASATDQEKRFVRPFLLAQARQVFQRLKELGKVHIVS